MLRSPFSLPTRLCASRSRATTTALLLFAGLLAPTAAFADDASQALFTANNVWMMLAAALVFIMHLGFAMVETGLTRAKNTTKHPLQEHLHHLLRWHPHLLHRAASI